MSLPNSFDLASGAGTVLLLEPDAVNDKTVALQESGEAVVAPIGGARYTSKDGSLPGGVWTFDFLTLDRATLEFLKDFFDTQRGMAGAIQDDGTSQGFWFPTWQWDLEIVSGADPTVNFVNRGYADSLFALGPQFRRYVLVYGSIYRAYKVSAAAVVGGLDQLTVSATNVNGSITAPTPWTRATGVRPLWLRYGRFDTDDFEYTHLDGGDAFQVTLPIRELPDEAP